MSNENITKGDYSGVAERNPMSPLRLAILIGVPLVIIGGATALFFLNPSEHSFFPQ